MKMKTSIISMVIGLLLFMPTSTLAEPEDNWGNGGPIPHLAPARQQVTVSYDEENNELSVLFRRTVEEAYLYVYKDGSLIGMDWLVGTTPGSTYTYYIEGSGTYTVVLQTEDGTHTLFEETI